MNYDWISHSGVKGMKWRKGRKSIIDPNNTDVKVNKKSEPRIENRKDLTLNGKSNKKFNENEKNVDNKTERNSLNDKWQKEAEKARQQREEAAKKALQDSIAAAKKRSNSKKIESAQEEPKKEEKKPEGKTYWVPQSKLKYIGTSNTSWKR